MALTKKEEREAYQQRVQNQYDEWAHNFHKNLAAAIIKAVAEPAVNFSAQISEQGVQLKYTRHLAGADWEVKLKLDSDLGVPDIDAWTRDPYMLDDIAASAVEVRQERERQQQLAQAKRAALAKLSFEEQRLLGLV